MHKYLLLNDVFGLFWLFMPLQMSVSKMGVLQNYQNFIEMTSNMIYIVAYSALPGFDGPVKNALFFQSKPNLA